MGVIAAAQFFFSFHFVNLKKKVLVTVGAASANMGRMRIFLALHDLLASMFKVELQRCFRCIAFLLLYSSEVLCYHFSRVSTI